MLPIAEVQRFAAMLPPHVASAVLLLATATIALIVGLVRSPRVVLREMPALVFVIAGAALLWPLSRTGIPPGASLVVEGIAAVGLVWHWILHRRHWAELKEGSDRGTRAASLYVVAALLLSS